MSIIDMTERRRGGNQGETRRKRPVIRIEAGKLHEMATAAERHLIEAGIPFFTRGNGVFRPIIVSLVDSAGRVTNSAALVQVERDFLRDILCAVIDWQRWSKGKNAWMPADAPSDVAAIMLARVGHWRFPPIGGIISTPTLRPDGSIVGLAGYDEATRLYVMDPVRLPEMSERPTKAEALDALELLNSLLDEFPFVDEASRSVALSALITPTVRGCMDVAPAHVSRAPTAGTGKSYLFDIAAAIALGHTCPVMAAGRTEEETEKRLGAKALAGHPVINIDNVNGELGGDTLCQMISQAICEIRVLGQSQMPRVVNRFCVFATGNNIRLVGDMTRRTLLCSMDARMEKPAERAFKDAPVDRVLADRGKYVAACLTIVRAYIAAGRPRVAAFPMNSFGMWSETVRGALIWLGRADPCDTIQTARDEDPELQQLAAFIDALKAANGVGVDRSLTSAEIIDRSVKIGAFGFEHPALHEALGQFHRAGKVDGRAFGKWLSGVKKKPVSVLRINSFEDKGKKVQRWYIEEL